MVAAHEPPPAPIAPLNRSYRIAARARLSEQDRRDIGELAAAAATHDGHRPLGEERWTHSFTMRDRRPSPVVGQACTYVTARTGQGWDDPSRRSPSDLLVAFAPLTRAPGAWTLDLVVHPDHRGLAGPAVAVVQRARDAAATCALGPVNLWVSRPSAGDDGVAAAAGFAPSRDLLAMRRDLPAGPTSLATRAFRPAADAEEWLAMNNRAFAGHPEQGGWTGEDLAARIATSWFDPEGLRVVEENGRIAGACWTRIHSEDTPPSGEIYVVATDPDFRGRGLGREIVLAGLAWLASRGLTVARLYVDAGNTTAVALYRDLGFAVDHLDRAYRARGT